MRETTCLQTNALSASLTLSFTTRDESLCHESAFGIIEDAFLNRDDSANTHNAPRVRCSVLSCRIHKNSGEKSLLHNDSCGVSMAGTL